MEQEPTDETLARDAQNGNADAFGTLVERYEAKLRRYGSRFLADREDVTDIVQDVFIRAYQNIRSFDTAQRFSPWIYRIAHNAFVNGLRSKSRKPFIALDLDTLVAHPVYDDSSVREREQREVREMTEQGLKLLSPKYREVLVLYYLEELSYQEVADILQVPVGTVGVRIKRAKEALRHAYEKLNMTYEPE